MNKTSPFYLSDVRMAGTEGQNNHSALDHERNKALDELVHHHDLFHPANDDQGPYSLIIGIENGQLALQIKNDEGTPLPALLLSLTPYRRLIQDYFLMIDSYEQCRHEGNCQKLQTIDMARRGLHNEGADLLMARLTGKINMDHETARRLFTLICVLHKTHMKLV
ncbi:MAG: UPF0262 family protein [Rhodospirillales bacterium]|nr:UPF0262 family protein [Rhodospirillales bacterium]